MASIRKEPGGRRAIQFTGQDGARKTLRLGKASAKDAELYRVMVEHLLAAIRLRTSPDLNVAAWVDGLSEVMHDRLARVGLINGRASATLGPFLDGLVASRAGKPNTLRNVKDAARRLVEHFGEKRQLASIGRHDADAWLAWLKRQYAPSTVGVTVSRAKEYFRAAAERGLVRASPVAHLKAPISVDETTKYFVTREQAERVLDACPDWRWRLLFSLARWGGLRCPSEPRALRRSDFDWERGRFLVDAPKNGARWVPIFPELVGPLNDAWDRAEEGEDLILPGLPLKLDGSWRGQFRAIRLRAGIAPWPRAMHNLRASRQTELEDRFPSHVVCAWLGNSESVARRHYLRPNDEHFERATRDVKSDVGERETTQKPPLQAAAPGGAV